MFTLPAACASPKSAPGRTSNMAVPCCFNALNSVGPRCEAQWYNELLSNCTSNIRLHIKHIGSAHPWDWQLLVNGSIDEHAYDLGAIDTSMPFVELKRLSHINDRARAADRDPAFSSRIWDGLPGMAIPW